MAQHAAHCPKLPWMLDFHSTAEGKIPNTQIKAAYASGNLEHVTELDIRSQVSKCRLTAIICTIGPSSTDIDLLEKLMEAGMTVARIKMSHCTNEECTEIIKNIRQATENYSVKIGRVYPLPIVFDIKGPEIRTGSLRDPDLKEIQLQQGCTTTLVTDPIYEEHVTEDMIYVDYQKINELIQPGDQLCIDNGKITLSAVEIVGNVIKCIIENAGKLASHASVNVPGIPVDVPAISEKDKSDLKLAVEENIDGVLISSSMGHHIIQDVREILGEAGKGIMIISKIENVQGIDNIDEIIKMSDGILIVRAQLGIELQPEKIFLAQKSITGKCNKVGKPIISATQMLDSMSISPKPTDSEISDVANSIIDGADCVLLSRATAIGSHPVEAVRIISAICKEAEAAVHQKQVAVDLYGIIRGPIEPVYAVAMSAVDASLKCNAAVIIVLTTTGRAAKAISQYRPRCPIVAVTRYAHVARKLHLYRGIDSLHFIKPLTQNWKKDVKKRIQFAATYGKVSGFIRAGDIIVIATGSRPYAGFTNAIKVVYASELDATLEVTPTR